MEPPHRQAASLSIRDYTLMYICRSLRRQVDLLVLCVSYSSEGRIAWA